jgi:peptidase M1-like protein
MKRASVLATLFWAVLPGGFVLLNATAAPALQDDDQRVRAVLQRLEEIVLKDDSSGYQALTAGITDRAQAEDFAGTELRPGATRTVIRERGRDQLTGAPRGAGYRLIVDAFVESGDRARIATWRVDLKKTDESEWRVVGLKRLSGVDNVYRLSVNSTRQFKASHFKLRSEDFDLTLTEGSVFTIDTDQGVTGFVLLGRGDLRFSPTPDTEKGQVKIFTGADTLESRFDAAYIRVGAVDMHADVTQLVERPIDPRQLRRAEQLFREESVKTFSLALGDLSPDSWSLLPAAGDFLAEVHTRRFDTLTYSRSRSESEDVSLFERRHQRKIAAYASAEKVASYGRFYDEDDLVEYDILDHDIDLSVDPERQWIEGRATVRLETRAPFVSQITMALAESLVVRSVVSDEYGWLFSVRVKNQNTLLVSLPMPLARESQITLRITYGGRLSPQPPDRETLALGQRSDPNLYVAFPQTEPNYLYSSRSYWYPQAPISDYATATMRISVPATLSCVGTGELASGSPTLVRGKQASQNRKVYQFTATRPLRYLAFIVSRFTQAEQFTIDFDTPPAGDDPAAGDASAAGTGVPGTLTSLDVRIESNPGQQYRGREIVAQTANIARFYQTLIGDAPYESFTLALVESDLPGGHSPGYFAILNQPRPDTPLVWHNDPANFQGYPEFFLAHELAHQWWGQAVGWANYHEQWLSEGFAQYFAALYAQHHHGDETFAAVLRHMRRWSIDQSAQGPVYLGNRLGHLRKESRVFRALVYNKGGVVLHMLRRLIGDEAFFRGIRRFYAESRFHKASTDQLRVAMEQEAGRPLERFFERWIYGSTLPRVTFSYRVESTAGGQEVVLHFEQSGELFDLPVTVTLQYSDRRSVDVVVPVTEQTVDKRVALDGPLRSVEISRDDGMIAEVSKAP